VTTDSALGTGRDFGAGFAGGLGVTCCSFGMGGCDRTDGGGSLGAAGDCLGTGRGFAAGCDLAEGLRTTRVCTLGEDALEETRGGGLGKGRGEVGGDFVGRCDLAARFGARNSFESASAVGESGEGVRGIEDAERAKGFNFDLVVGPCFSFFLLSEVGSSSTLDKATDFLFFSL
jgi:hypothetical protein